jgi:hypothetical protein
MSASASRSSTSIKEHDVSFAEEQSIMKRLLKDRESIGNKDVI